MTDKEIAVIKTGGKQYLVSPGDRINIEKVETGKDKKVNFDKVLLLENKKGEFSVGTPYLEGVKVLGEVEEEGLGEKKRVFKYKPKKRYRVKKGSRQPYTLVKISKFQTSKS